MLKSRALFKDTTDVLIEAFPVLLKGLSEVSEAFPFGSAIKGVANTTIFLMEKVEKYKTSRKDIYLLAARAAQVVTTIVNAACWGAKPLAPESDVDRNLKKVNAILQEVSSWLEIQTLTTNRVIKAKNRLRPEDNIEMVDHFNRRLDEAIALFGLESQISTQKTSSDILDIVKQAMDSLTHMERRRDSVDMIQFIEKKLPPRVETLTSSDPQCLPGTRQDILGGIKEWLPCLQSTSSVAPPAIYWLKGVSGSGKSTIARSVIEMAQDQELACSWFRFSRDVPDRQTSRTLMTTVAHDLISLGDETLIQEIYHAISKNKIDGTKSLPRQMEGFLECPIRAAGLPLVLVWDALDECTESRDALLDLLDTLPKLPPSTRIFLISRPDDDLERARERLGKKAPIKTTDITPNSEDKHGSTSRDIEAYIRDRSEHMRIGRKDWFESDTINRLTRISDGMFMIARFVCDLIDHRQGRRRLISLLEEPKYGEGSNSLYLWYRTGLEHLFGKDTEDEMQQAKAAMAAILVVQYPVSGKVLATLLDLDEDTTESILDCLSPFLIRDEGKTSDVEGLPHTVRFVHKSMTDFFLSNEAGEFRIDGVLANGALALPCLQILHDQLSAAFELYHFSSSSSLSDKHYRRDGQTPQVSEALSYVCRAWGYHLKDVAMPTEDVEKLANDLFMTHLLEWLHLMGHLDALDAAESCLYWIVESKLAATHSQLRELAKDGIHFIRTFFYPLTTYTNMISPTLHFTPTNTLLYQTYSAKVPRSCIVKGIPDNWPLFSSILGGHKGIVASVAYSPDGKYIISGSEDATVCIWDASTRQLLVPPLKGHTDWVRSVAFSQNGRYIVSGSGDKTLRIWEASTGQPCGSPLEGHTGPVTSVACSQDGRHVVSGSGDDTVRIWDATTREPLGPPLEGHTGWVMSVAFSPDGKYITSGSEDATVRLWDTSTGLPVGLPLKGHTDWVRSVMFSQDGRYVVSGSGDKTLRIWEASTGQPFGLPLEGHTGPVTSVAISRDGRHIVSGSGDKTLRVWDVSAGKPVGLPLEGHTGRVMSVAFSHDGRNIVSGSKDKTLRIWDVSGRQQSGPPLESHMLAITSIAFSQDGKRIVSGSDDKRVRIWDASTGQPTVLPMVGHTEAVTSVAFSHDGKHIVSGSSDKTVRTWNASTGQPLGPAFEGHTDQVMCVVFSRDGRHIVSGSSDKTVRIWDATTKKPLGPPLEGHTGWVTSVAFSQDGMHVVSGSYYKTVRIWDETTRRPLGPPVEGHTHKGRSVAFSQYGTYMVSGSRDNTTRFWDVSTGQPLESYRTVKSRDVGLCDLLGDGWLETFDGQQICWLPPHHCGYAMAWSETSHSFAVGGRTGLLTIVMTD